MTTDQPNTSKPRRRWFQFSLRTLFVLLTVLCIWLGVTVNRASRQRRAVAAIRELGGSFRYDYQVDSTGKLLPKAKPPGPKWLRRWIGNDYFVSMVFVLFWNPQVTDAGLEHLKGLTNLQELDLHATQITDAGLMHLPGLTNLEKLNLDNTQVTGPGLVHLKGMTKLEWLMLDNTQVTDAGLEHLTGLTKLKWLDLQHTQVTEEGVKKLRQALPKCQIIHIIRSHGPPPTTTHHLPASTPIRGLSD